MAADNRHDVLSLENVASELMVTTKTAWRMLQRGDLPNAFKAGRDWRIPRSDVEAYIAARRVQPKQGKSGAA